MRNQTVWTRCVLAAVSVGSLSVGSLAQTLSPPRSEVTSRPVVVAVDSQTPGLLDLVRVTEQDQVIRLPELQRIELADLDLASVGDSRWLRPDLPGTVTIDRTTALKAIRLPDRSTVLRSFEPAANTTSLIRVSDTGDVDILREERILEPDELPIPGVVAASDHAPFMAYVALDGTEVTLYRYDGKTWPGSGNASWNVTPPGARDLEEASVVFGKNVLAVVDDELGLFLISLSTGQALRVSFPPSGGRIPEVFDEELAVSEGGRHFAFGAGRDDKIKDVYVIRDDGVAINVTQFEADYQEVGYEDADGLIKMTLNADGSSVSYIDTSTYPEPECFVTDVANPDPVLITSSETFVDSVDIGTVIRATLTGGVVIVAGMEAGLVDIYHSEDATDESVVNLTKSSPLPDQPPFGLGSRLRLLEMAATHSSNVYVANLRQERGFFGRSSSPWLEGPHSRSEWPRFDGHDELVLIEPTSNRVRVVAKEFSGLADYAGKSGFIAAVNQNELVVVDPADSSARFKRTFSVGPHQRVFDLGFDRSGATVYLAAGSQEGATSLYALDLTTGTFTTITTDPQALGSLLGGHDPRGLLFIGEGDSAAPRPLRRYRKDEGLVDLGVTHVRFFLQRS